ncbi:MAG: tryptophan synthase subunit alpha [Candidatus Margulisbacteria bacterium]|nr:tryptophan synthase subunit alpha [Candidatus Margulisiibacteriota bacterium]
MSNLSKAFESRKALITYVTAGDPALGATEKLIYDLEKAGADIVELGIPFSDPLADGPVIQASHQRALKKNVSLSDVFKLVAKVRKKTQIPICFMLAYNLVMKYGEDNFYRDCEKTGVDGVVIPDLPPEESRVTGHESRVDRIAFVSPTSTESRIKLAAERATGFIYLISVAGITGKREAIAGNLAQLVEKIKKYSNLPIAIGFGISTPAQAAQAIKLADGVIVGSAIVDRIARKKINSVPKFVASLRTAIDA